MRCFIAIPLPKEIQDEVRKTKVKDDIALVSYPKEELHLTLKFLGDVPISEVKKISESLSKIKFKNFKTNLGKIGFFPKKKGYVKVVWAGLTPKRKIIELKNMVDDALVWRFNREKDYEPHITICRVKEIKNDKRFRDTFNRTLEGSFSINCFRLMKAEFTENNVIHTLIKEYK